MVKDRVKHHPDPGFVQRGHDLLQVFIGPETDVHLAQIPLVIAMGIRRKERIEKHRAHAELPKMRNIILYLQEPVRKHAVILPRCPAKTQRIDLVDRVFKCPHIFSSKSFSTVILPKITAFSPS